MVACGRLGVVTGGEHGTKVHSFTARSATAASITVLGIAIIVVGDALLRRRCIMRWLQLRFDFDSTAIRPLIKGHLRSQ